MEVHIKHLVKNLHIHISKDTDVVQVKEKISEALIEAIREAAVETPAASPEPDLEEERHPKKKEFGLPDLQWRRFLLRRRVDWNTSRSERL